MDADGPTTDGIRAEAGTKVEDGAAPEDRTAPRDPQQGSLPLTDGEGDGVTDGGTPDADRPIRKGANGKAKVRPTWLESMEGREAKATEGASATEGDDSPPVPAAPVPEADAAAGTPDAEPVEKPGRGPVEAPVPIPVEAVDWTPVVAPPPAAPKATAKPSPSPAPRHRPDSMASTERIHSYLADADVDEAVEHLRAEARHSGQADAQSDVPGPDSQGPTESEMELRERCRAFFQRWFSLQRREAMERIAVAEERAAEKLGRISLGIDRFQRLTNELVRLKARYSVRKDEVTADLATEGRDRPRGIPTKVYALALAFLGLVEFFANAPVFSALLPRDPLTERQIRVLTEMSEGWFAGAERVLAQIVFRPDAALLAAGVITFLCVLCHFFGASLRELVMQRGTGTGRYTVQGRSSLENAVPLVLTSLGLILVLGVLYQARMDLGEVGEERYTQDMSQVEEFRREAGWLRVDGELLAANELTNRADDLQEAAVELREYSQSMARMSFPILLLNLTLVLCAISAAYFHRRDARREHFNELPFEVERKQTIERAEDMASEISAGLADVVRDIREIKSLATLGPGSDWRSVVHQLESVVTLYRVENGRARGIDPRTLPAFATPPRLELEPSELGHSLVTRSPDDYERERADLSRRFNEVRDRFNEEASATWA